MSGGEADLYELDAWYRGRDVRDVQRMQRQRRMRERERALGPKAHTAACRAGRSPFCTCNE